MQSETDDGPTLETVARDLLARLRAGAPDALSGRELAKPYDDTARVWLALGGLCWERRVEVVGGYDPGVSGAEQWFAATGAEPWFAIPVGTRRLYVDVEGARYMLAFDARRDASRFIVVNAAETKLVASGLIDSRVLRDNAATITYDEPDSPLADPIERRLRTAWLATQLDL